MTVLIVIQLILVIIHVFILIRLVKAREGLDKMILHLVEESSTQYAQNRRLNQKTSDNLQTAARHVKELNGVKRILDLFKENADSLKEIATSLKNENQSVGRSLMRLSTSISNIEKVAKDTNSLKGIAKSLEQVVATLNKIKK